MKSLKNWFSASTCLTVKQKVTSFRLGILICVVVIGVYNVLFFNRYLPIVEGWHSVYASCLLDGLTPYVDFHFFLPPLYPAIIATFTFIFGPSFLLLRIFGIVVILSMATTLFLLFSRLFPAHVASIATIVSVIYYQSTVTHITYDFLAFVTLFALLGTLFICRYCDYSARFFERRQGWTAAAFLFFAGLSGALALLVKQSGGLFVIAFSFLAVAIVTYAKDGLRKTFQAVAIYSVGTLVPLLALLIWLASNHALAAFWNQVIVGAASSKGGLAAILFAWVPRLFTTENVGILVRAVLVIIALIVCCLPQGFMLRRLGDRNDKSHLATTPKRLAVFSVILVLFMLCILLPFWNIDLSHKLMENSQLAFIYYRVPVIVGSTASFVLFCVFFLKILRERKTFNCDVFIIVTVSLGLIWGCGTAVGVGEVALILVTGLLIGIALSVRSRFNVIPTMSVVLCLFLVLFMVSLKYIHPYNWWGLDQPDIRTTSTPLKGEYYHGFIVSEQTARVYTEVPPIVEKYTRPGDHIYTFPNIPIFYLLTDRYPDTFGIVSWFDVMSDPFAEDDARHLIESPPKVIIYLDVPEFVWEGHEEAFRSGEPSGQRMIKEAIERLTSSGNYHLEARYDVPDGYTLSVWRLLQE